MGQSHLQNNFSSFRARIQADRTRVISTSLATTQIQFLRLAGHLQGQALTQTESTDGASLAQSIDSNWDLLNFEWGITTAALYSQREIVESWGDNHVLTTVPTLWLQTPLTSEQPLSKIWCPNNCWQITIVPVLSAQRGPQQLLLMATSLADTLVHFQANTGTHVGVLLPQRINDANNQRIIPWQSHLATLTGKPESLEVIQQLAQEMKLNTLKQRSTVVSRAQKSTEVSLLPLLSEHGSADAHLIVLDDVTNELATLSRNRQYFFAVCFGALLLTELVLLAMLRGPMRKLQRLVQFLPSLAGDNRRHINKQLQISPSPDYLRSEITNLLDATSALANTLQTLDKTVASRTQKLKSRSQELLQERNFVNSLLNNVHVVILTQRHNGSIKLANAEGHKLLASLHKTTHHTRFIELVNAEQRLVVAKDLACLWRGELEQNTHETVFKDRLGQTIYMEWFHTKLPQSVTDDALLLSVGLDLTARKSAEMNLAWLADHDPLTELLNRRRFQSEFEHVLKNTNPEQPGALFFFDIDQFKHVNDTSGHPAGDQLLLEVACVMKAITIPDDLLARLGGDEFAVVRTICSPGEAERFAEQFCDAVRAIKYFSRGNNHHVSLSVGVVLFPIHGHNIDDLMANADLAMYRAKSQNNARSTWQLYRSDTPDKAAMHHLITWKRKIEQALSGNQYLLYFQPIFNITANKITHYESLLRIKDERGAIILPNQFISVAESSGLIYEIDRLVVSLAVAALAQLHQCNSELSLSVNLSAKAVSDKDFLQLVEEACEGILRDKSKLIFELTETSALEDVASAAKQINRFRNLGYKFALDDFGVGFSSWYYLRQLPVDFVKIDGSFVRNLSHNLEDRLFVKAINDVAQGLGKHTIAEFVEDHRSLELLTTMGVNFAQGYQLGKPQSLGEVLSNFASAS